MIESFIRKCRLGGIERERVVEPRIPVLTYHHHLPKEIKSAGPFKNGSVTNTVESFLEQMTWLHDHGYKSLTLSEFECFLRCGEGDFNKRFLITFDDGHLSTFFYCLPILIKFNFTAVVFMITSRIPARPADEFDPNILQFISKVEMDFSQPTLEWASHTHNMHGYDNNKIPKLISSDIVDIISDSMRSRDILNGTTHFCFPFGKFDERAVDILVAAGYRFFYTTNNGFVVPKQSERIFIVDIRVFF